MLPVAIVGGGPAGLALAQALRSAGVGCTVFERGRVGNAWRHHYDRLRLHTLKAVSHLPGLPMPPSYPDFPTRAQVVAYLEAYAQAFALPVIAGVTVQRATFANDHWALETSIGPQAASTLVAATGIWSAPTTPALPGQAAFQGVITPGHEYRNPAPFLGQRVLVVGAGNTGAEIAVDLAEAGVAVSISVRSGITLVPRPRSATLMRLSAWLLPRLPRPLANAWLRRARRSFAALGLPPRPVAPVDAYPVVGFELPEAVAAGRVTTYGAVASLTATGAHFADGRAAPFDAIITATGYRPALDFLGAAIERDARGWPILDGYRSTRNPHLFCIGYAYPATSGWLQALPAVIRAAAPAIQADSAR